ncbi:MAG TPA: DUF2298 domain-containing protein [Vicinamibacterales bacterium]
MRLTGIGWGERQHQHPDETHLVTVLDSLRARACRDPSILLDDCPEAGKRWLYLVEYLDGRRSTLNPYNRGIAFFVYGNLPLTLTRIAVEAFGVDDLRGFGRGVSAAADIWSILFLYLIAARLYGHRVGLLAAAFSAFCVLQIQQSHFFTTDLFVNAFALPAVYCAVAIATADPGGGRRRDILLSVSFGLALGMALASKVSILPLALVLPAAFLLRKPRDWRLAIGCASVGALAALITFRICQPYAFVGLSLNPQWIANLSELRAMTSLDADVPWNLQWARRSYLYSFTNLTVWGLGLPLGITAWAGVLFMGWRIARGERRHALLWGWTIAYFVWQSLQLNPTMRYQLPVYPMLAMIAAWMIVRIADWRRILGFATGTVVLALTMAWAVAFLGIYLREEPRIAASRWIFQNVPAAANLQIQLPDGSSYNQPLAPGGRGPHAFDFTPKRDGRLTAVYLPRVHQRSGGRVAAIVSTPGAAGELRALAEGTAVLDGTSGDTRGVPIRLELESPVDLVRGTSYLLTIRADDEGLELSGATFANETDFDYALPFRIDGYDPFGGLYRGDLNLQVYWDDTTEKLDRLVGILDQADFIFLPTNHQYAQITRLPERYPLTTLYYRELIGCPPSEAAVAACYDRARPGMFEGRLGFELAAVFESYPRLGPFEINDQSAEEAFTFYDHPKVLIFRKSPDFDPDRVRSILTTADLTHLVRLPPRRFDSFKGLMLAPEALERQRSGGTWSRLFSSESLLNDRPMIAAVVWYLFVTLAGLIFYPFLRFAFRGLPDRGYPLSRAAGLLSLGYLTWLAGSMGLLYSRGTIAAVFGLLLLAGGWLAVRQRTELLDEWRSRWRYFLSVETIALGLFVAALLVRIANPDLWHPARGGERPMDFSYLNAVIRSTTFPPYDPWFAGGYINYYYFGFVILGTPVKLLGIVPAIAYNLMVPTVFALTALGAFSLGWNLQALGGAPRWQRGAGGFASAAATVLLGNLASAQLVRRWFAGDALQPGEWYWNPSRVIPSGTGHEITEFPLFTFVYGDLHAHMLVMPLALLALGVACAFVAARDLPRRFASDALALVIAALVVGAIYPTNLADGYTYLAIVAAAIGWRTMQRDTVPRDAARACGMAMLFVAVSFLLFRPFHANYAKAYGAMDLWSGPTTTLSSYLTHWTLLLLPVLWWMAAETREWIRLMKRGRSMFLAPAIAWTIGVLALAGGAALAAAGVTIAFVVVPIVAWAALLMWMPASSAAKRFVLALAALALLITLAVDVVVVRGDIGRQNTVFKFYLQAWMLLAAGAGAAIAWTLAASRRWSTGPRCAWRAAVVATVAFGSLFGLTGIPDKLRDRWAPAAPHTLDGMAYMPFVRHEDFNTRLDLAEDYRAIRWMQENVPGSPVIVEGHCSEYRWCSRFTVYTGLPGVVGWNFHQRQQRMFVSNWVTRRVDDIDAFYTTPDPTSSRRFLETYDVRYIIVGQLERARYAPEGLEKFDRFDGQLWRTVYRDGRTTIYETLE